MGQGLRIIIQKMFANKKNLIIFLFIFSALFFLKPIKTIQASEGISKIRSVSGGTFRCFLSSLQTQTLKYKILVSCRDLLYPANTGAYSYVMWANPEDGGKPDKLGPLGLGKAEFETKKAFTSVFVTTETNDKVRTPSKTVVMRGTLEPLAFLDKPSATAPTPTDKPSLGPENGQETSSQNRLATALKRAGLVIALAGLFIVIIFLFVLTRSRR